MSILRDLFDFFPPHVAPLHLDSLLHGSQVASEPLSSAISALGRPSLSPAAGSCSHSKPVVWKVSRPLVCWDQQNPKTLSIKHQLWFLSRPVASYCLPLVPTAGNQPPGFLRILGLGGEDSHGKACTCVCLCVLSLC